MSACQENRKARLKRAKQERRRHLARLAKAVDLCGHNSAYYEAKVKLSSSGKHVRSRIVPKPSYYRLIEHLRRMCNDMTVDMSAVFPRLNDFKNALPHPKEQPSSDT